MPHKQNNIYNQLLNDVEKEFDVFEPNDYNLFFIKAIAGSGKTYNIFQFLKHFYGKYYTKNDTQEYLEDDGSIKYIPAGEGNIASEPYELFIQKTKSQEDLIWANRYLRGMVIAYNTDIKKEIGRKISKDFVLKDVGEDKLLTKTSHALLFSYAQKIGLFPERNEQGEYTDGKIKINFAKGDFNLQDTFIALNLLKSKSKFFKNSLENINNKDYFKLAKVTSEIIKTYYNTDIVIRDSKDLEKLIDISQKISDFDIRFFLNSLFNNEQKKIIKEKSKLESYLALLKYAIQAFKIGVREGNIELGHSYYYKEVFNQCMRDENKLVELFSLNHNPAEHLNVIIVDEAQDLTPIMTRLLIEYYKAAKKRNFEVTTMLVGDEKQAIYQFANRVNSFDVISRELGANNIKNYILNKSYRVPAKICELTNAVCKRLDIYDEKTKLIPAKPFEGHIQTDYKPLDEVIKDAIVNDKKLFILGRTNAEILVNFIKVYVVLNKQEDAKNYLKYIKIDSKLKKEFKKLLKDGMKGINDEELLEKLQVALGKKNITFSDILKEEVKEIVPNYLKEFAKIHSEFNKADLDEALNYRVSTKPNVKFLTIHASKGLESNNVYLLNGNMNILDADKENNTQKREGIVSLKALEEFENLIKSPNSTTNITQPNNQNSFEDKKEKNENELLMEKYLLYVALTRTKNNLYMQEELLNRFKDDIQKIEAKFSKANKEIVKNQIKI
jgi:ATP-dependent exoDNAse (exonuclease V) beta subunit